jgi:hypothetical protein
MIERRVQFQEAYTQCSCLSPDIVHLRKSNYYSKEEEEEEQQQQEEEEQS